VRCSLSTDAVRFVKDGTVTRLAEKRDTHLTPAEIAAETLAQFDRPEGEPSIRSLAAALRVKPAAIYHHFPSRAAVIEAAIELVWQEVNQDGYEMIPDPLAADPADVLVAAAIATRRGWLRHYRLAPYMAATPESTDFISTALALLANVFERLGYPGEEASGRFHTYASFVLGGVLFAAARLSANERLEKASKDKGEPVERFHSEVDEEDASHSDETTRISLDAVMDISSIDPERDERLFVDGLRRLIKSFG
jgi:AcrR family transcriptional regulator